MQKVFIVIACFILMAFASQLTPFHIPENAVTVEQFTAEKAPFEIVCEYRGMTKTPPWHGDRNPPWEANVHIDDVYDTDDFMCSMAEDATGRVYVCYETVNGTGSYAWGIATSTDQGTTWDNRAYYATGLNVRYPEIAIMDDGKIWIFGSLVGGSYNDEVLFMYSFTGAYNDPDSLDGFYWFGPGNLNYRTYPEVVTYGNDTQLILTSWTYDNQAATETVLSWVFNSAGGGGAWQIWSLNADGNPDGMTSVGVNVDGPWYIAVHGWEELVGGTDWNVRCIFDTLDTIAHTLGGWSTSNTNNDRYPSVFCSEGYGYIAYEADVGGNNDIMFNYSTDNGYTWLGTMLNLTNDAANETFARLYGYNSTIGLVYNYGGPNVRFNYSLYYGQDGTWLVTPETVDDASSAFPGYHCAGLLYTPSYMYTVYEDDRDIGTEGMEYYSARRTTPIGIQEYHDPLMCRGLTATPNPFHSAVRIDYSVGSRTSVTIEIYDIVGSKIRTLVNSVHAPQQYSVSWCGTDDLGNSVPAGVYVCRVEAANQIRSNKLIFMR